MARALSVPVSALLAEPEYRVEFIAFRKGSRMTKTEQESVKSTIEIDLRDRVRLYGMLNADMPSGLEAATIKFVDSSRGRDKVLWGSHAFSMTRWVTEFKELPLRDETRRKVLRDNPMKVFKLD